MDMSAQLDIKVAKLETEVEGIKEDITEIKDEIKVVHGRITEGNEKVMEKLGQMSKDSDSQHNAIVDRMNVMDKRINGRITVLEQWRWLVVGGAVVVGWIISHSGIIDKLIG
jgi:predicted  nucleic acid-binding Zn-ribbon protein